MVGTIHGSCAERAVAALSADPVTLEELEISLNRYAKHDRNRRQLSNLSKGLNDEPYAAGLVVIDLIARFVVIDSTYFHAERSGIVFYHNGNVCTETEIPYHLAEDWLFSNDSHGWQRVAEERRQERAATPILDVRAILFGRPMIEFLARGVFDAFHRVPKERAADAPKVSTAEGEVDEQDYEAIKKIHADWLLTPREDLRGACPREVSVAGRSHIEWELQDRGMFWNFIGHCPRGLAESSYAYRNGGLEFDRSWRGEATGKYRFQFPN